MSPVELVDAAIERIDRCDPVLNAVIHRRFAAARAEAAGDLPDGPFRGVPLLLKDLGATQAGEPYCEGTAFAKAADYRAKADSYLVQRFRKAGFVVVGRTNTPELGTTITTEPRRVRRDAQPLEHGAFDRRLVRWRRGRSRVRHGPRRSRQ